MAASSSLQFAPPPRREPPPPLPPLPTTLAGPDSLDFLLNSSQLPAHSSADSLAAEEEGEAAAPPALASRGGEPKGPPPPRPVAVAWQIPGAGPRGPPPPRLAAAQRANAAARLFGAARPKGPPRPSAPPAPRKRMMHAKLENLPEPTWPPLLAEVREFRSFCAQKRAEVILQLPATVLDSFFDARVVEQQSVSDDEEDETETEQHALLVHLPVSGLVWKVDLPFFVDLEAPGAPSVGKLRRHQRTLTIQGLREAKKKQRKPCWQRPLVVRSLSGREVHKLDSADETVRIGDIVRSVCESTDARSDEVQLVLGDHHLRHDRRLGQCIPSPEHFKELEINFMVVQGPSFTARASSGARIEVLDGVPERREDCHFDRDYVFNSLGDFASRPRMRYVMTCNEDRKMTVDRIMWQLDLRVPATVYLNFRSQRHAERVSTWIARDGWEEQDEFRSAVSSGYPNGPYSGPVYAKYFRPQNRQQIVNLMGSDCWEGTYFVFLEPDCEE